MLKVACFELVTFTFCVGNHAVQQKGRKINKCLFKTRLIVSKCTSASSSYGLFHAPGQESAGFFHHINKGLFPKKTESFL